MTERFILRKRRTLEGAFEIVHLHSDDDFDPPIWVEGETVGWFGVRDDARAFMLQKLHGGPAAGSGGSASNDHDDPPAGGSPAGAPCGPCCCPYCKGEPILHYGSGPFAELRACSICEDGRKLADTTLPVARGAMGDGRGG